jgi:MraZ protein
LFSGGSEHSVDDKGRFVMPVRFRKELGTNFVITRGIDRCLFVLTEEYWKEQFESVFMSLPALDPSNIRLQRHFAAEASRESNIDGQGRVPLPASLREYAGISAESSIVAVGVTTRIELWDKETWVALSTVESEAMLADAIQKSGLGSRVPAPVSAE